MIDSNRKSWNSLSTAEKADIMKMAIGNGIYNLEDIKGIYKEFAEGGKIHIDPSKKGTFTAAASRHGKSVQEFASQVLAHPENYSPAMRKKANFARNAAKWHGYGGYLYADGGEKETNLGFWGNTAIKAARLFGLDKKYKGDKDDFQYRENIYNMVNPVAGVPMSVSEVIKYKRIADDARSGKKYPYTRTHTEPGAEAAWAKRLGLPYDKSILLDNADGSVRLSSELEKEIPTDTLFLKDRIQKNKDLLEYNRKHRIYNKDRNDAIEAGLKADNDALNALRETYKTGKPVVLNEYSHVNRHWINNGMVDPYKLTPLSLMQNYTVRYDKDSNTMEYNDIYDFNGLEDFVPGEPFDIRGRIKLGNRKK